MTDFVRLLADAAQSGGAEGAGGAAGGAGGAGAPGGAGLPCFSDPQMLIPLVLMFIVFWFLLLRPQTKERKRREQMLAAVKKNDRVTTIGGIMGTVVSVKDNEITVKVDESNNTKITFSRSAIQQVTSGDSGDTSS